MPSRRPDPIKRPRGATPLRKVGRLVKTAPDIVEASGNGRNVGGRVHPEQVCLITIHIPRPALAGQDMQFTADVLLGVRKGGILPHRQTIAGRYRVLAHKRGKPALIQQKSLRPAPDRVWTIQHQKGFPCRAAGTH